MIIITIHNIIKQLYSSFFIKKKTGAQLIKLKHHIL